MKDDELAYLIWHRVDIKRKIAGLTLESMANQIGVKVQRIKTQRTRNIIPQADDLCHIAKVINTTCEYLVTGQEPDENPFFEYLPYLERCPADRLDSVRLLLGMPLEKKFRLWVNDRLIKGNK